MKLENLTGQRFGRLIVIKQGKSTWKSNRTSWDCACNCGNKINVASKNLKNGRTQSCGCLMRDSARERGRKSIKHGMEGTKPYKLWGCIKARCYNPNNPSYRNYGARGISMCEEWRNDFKMFYDWVIANGYGDGLQIDRIDKNGNYEPNNCRFITCKENQRNRRDNILITIGDETKTVSAWAEESGINYHTMLHRVKCGWGEERLLKQTKRG